MIAIELIITGLIAAVLLADGVIITHEIVYFILAR